MMVIGPADHSPPPHPFFYFIFFLFSFLPRGHSEPDWGRALRVCVCCVFMCESLLEWQEANE